MTVTDKRTRGAHATGARSCRGLRWRRFFVAAAVLASLMSLLAVAGMAVWYATRPRGDEAPARLVSSAPSPTYTRVPAGEVRMVHDTLHGLGEVCAQSASWRTPGDVDEHVAGLLDFVRRHPQGRFQIDDENGTSLSLLFVLREELRTCAPAAARQVEELLPAQHRDSGEPGA